MEQIVELETGITELTVAEVDEVAGAFFPLVAAFAVGFGIGTAINRCFLR